ncbi:hypothetical protein FQN55_009285 [Onygenales sp. PD_40]|nr:hypothetical protein FQN55_009285 [Onygenales sp. PD_40]
MSRLLKDDGPKIGDDIPAALYQFSLPFPSNADTTTPENREKALRLVMREPPRLRELFSAAQLKMNAMVDVVKHASLAVKNLLDSDITLAIDAPTQGLFLMFRAELEAAILHCNQNGWEGSTTHGATPANTPTTPALGLVRKHAQECLQVHRA